MSQSESDEGSGSKSSGDSESSALDGVLGSLESLGGGPHVARWVRETITEMYETRYKEPRDVPVA